ncbi:MAG: molybdenum cofactor biosynthesis protein MoaE [Chloroflexota bacterium]|nr:molybdenum cofactor biosynthesis protein MoaE [Chloroflexota bacterium]|tara:strand:+ start:485 stop:1126 length:642 start_codon:yes stop_codon:yes gene_type:complete
MKIRLFASLKDDFGSSFIEIAAKKNMNVKDLRRLLINEYSINAENCMVAVNMEYVKDEFTISSDDEVSLIPPVSGGSSNDVVEIVDNVINPEDYSISKLSSYGAELTFLGISRDFNDGKKVNKLFYECYEEMAKKEIFKLIDMFKDKFGIGYIRVVHRVGEVSPGNISLLVIMSSAHRKESLEGMIEFLDIFKKKIPIWKKEIYLDGSKWIES